MRRWPLIFPLLLIPIVAHAATPTNLRVDGIPDNAHVIPINGMTMCWDNPDMQLAYIVQIEDDPNFLGADPNGTCLSKAAFWDTGRVPDPPGTTHCVKEGDKAISLCGASFYGTNIEYRPHPIFWRVKTQNSAGAWSSWANSTFKLNFPPLWPTGALAALDANTSTGPVQTDPNTVSGTTYFLDGSDANSCDDPNTATCGETGTPFRTFTYALTKLVAGDTLKVRGDPNTPYNEFVEIGPSLASGDATNPITVINDTGHTPVVYSSRSATVYIHGVHDWVIDGLAVATTKTTCDGGTDFGPSCMGIHIANADDISIKHYSIPTGYFPSYQTTSIGTVAIGLKFVNNARITASTFTGSVADFIQYSGGNSVTIQSNEFSSDPNTLTSKTIHDAIHSHPGAHGNIVVDSNYFHDLAVAGDAVVFNYKGSWGRHTNNVFYNIKAPNPVAFWADRSGPFEFVGNTCYGVLGMCASVSHGTGFWRMTNNIAMVASAGTSAKGFGVGTGELEPGSASKGGVFDYNLCRNITNCYTINDQLLLDHQPLGVLTNTDPNFASVDPNNRTTTFLRPTTPGVVDPNFAGNDLPVPTSGGNFRAMGRFDPNGACASMTCIYGYQNTVSNIMDITPSISWAFRDEDNLLDALDPNILPPGDIDFQTRAQIQIDTVPTFDSRSPAHPLLDSGAIYRLDSNGRYIMTNSSWAVPYARALDPNITYYYRVRTSDDEDPLTWGPWSDPTKRFGMDLDQTPVAVQILYQVPADNAVNVDCTPAKVRVAVKSMGGTIDCSPAGSWQSSIDGGVLGDSSTWCGSQTSTELLGGCTSVADACFPALTGITPDACESFGPGGGLCNAGNLSTAGSIGNLSEGPHTWRYVVTDSLGNSVDHTINFTCKAASVIGAPSTVRIYQTP